MRGWRRNIENLGELFLHATIRVRLVKCGLCSFQGVFRSALSRNEPPETFSLQTVQEAIKPQVCTFMLLFSSILFACVLGNTYLIRLVF